MNGLEMLLFMFIGAVGGWCAYALVRGGTAPRYPLPPEVQRRMNKWDGTR